MPLLKGKENIGHNVKEMEAHGHSKAQSVAAALRTALDRTVAAFRGADESEVERERAHGKLTEKERETASPHVAHREGMPATAFLEGAEHKYPVKVERNGRWEYDRDLLLAAQREATMHGHADLAARARSIRTGMSGDNGGMVTAPSGGIPAGRTMRASEDGSFSVNDAWTGRRA